MEKLEEEVEKIKERLVNCTQSNNASISVGVISNNISGKSDPIIQSMIKLTSYHTTTIVILDKGLLLRFVEIWSYFAV